jgi:hypothetical protein
MWKKVYNHENVITLDELPNLKTYPLKAAVSKCNISLSASSYTYSGTAKKPTVTVKYGAKTLKKGTDYTVSYSNNVNAGTAKVTIKGIGDYAGTTVKTFKISAKSISSASVTGVKSAYVYTGKKISPAVTVKLGGTALKKGTAYTVSYSANTSAGKAKVVVKGKGNYSGTVTKYFNIVPKKQTVTGIRSPKAKQFKVAWKKDTQASGYEIYYSSRSDFKTHKTVTVSKKYTSKTVTGVTSGKKYYVKVRSYKLIGGKRVYGKYSAAKSVKIK